MKTLGGLFLTSLVDSLPTIVFMTSDICLKASSRDLIRSSNLDKEQVLGEVELTVSRQSEGSGRLYLETDLSKSRV